MGLLGSKMLDELSEESKPSTPISQKPLRVLKNDPRSPSSGISRTPIQRMFVQGTALKNQIILFLSVEKTPTNSKLTSIESNATSSLERPVYYYGDIDNSRSPTSHYQKIPVNDSLNADQDHTTDGKGKMQENKEISTDDLKKLEKEGSDGYKNESKLTEDCPKPLLKTCDRMPLVNRINVNSLCVRLLHQQLEEKKKTRTSEIIQEDKEN
ncbi:uncharacterized protein LOC143237733 isoform X1 [Tachypleus tridentatus]|uniref:uncharacterized protein LOC143237733 isoform X1 n=1 Tax=Tachypleus tridentatus TaxID=6853 RepID=UPI003FD42755